LGVAPLPVNGTPATIYSSAGYAISAEAEEPEAVWEWLTYLTYQASLMESWPARYALENSVVFPLTAQSAHHDLSQAYRTSLVQYQNAETILWNESPHQDVCERLITLALRNAWERQGTPQELLAQAQVTFERYLNCVENDYSETRLDACAEQVGVPDWLSLAGLEVP
jgi:ABC-type glycerol-3-phosphate transport system substrate-binding protein